MSTAHYKIFICVMFLMNLYVTSCLTSNLMFTQSMIRVFFYPHYFIVFFLLILLVVLKTAQYLKTDYLQQIRFDKYESYLNYEVKQIIYSVSSCWVLNLLMLILMLVLFNITKIDFNNTFNSCLYFVLYIVRFYIFTILYSMINALLFNVFDSKKMVVINLLILIALPNFLLILPHMHVDKFNTIPFLFLEFFSDSQLFSNFGVEICATTGHIFVLSIIYNILYDSYLQKKM